MNGGNNSFKISLKIFSDLELDLEIDEVFENAEEVI